MIWQILEARRTSKVGVFVEGEEGEGGSQWVRPAPWVAVAKMDVEPCRERLVAENAWITRGLNIDYGNTLGLCEEIQTQQEQLVRQVLQSMGAPMKGVRVEFEGKAQVMAGPGAVYHVDTGFGIPAALFVVTALTGDAVLRLPEIDVEVSLEPGVTVLFDSLQVHGLVGARGDGIGATPFVVVTRTVLADADAAARLGLVEATKPEGGLDLGESQVDACTGRIVPRQDV